MIIVLLVILLALLLVDWRQTLAIFAVGRWETNRVIRWAHARWGRRGIDGYFACWVAAVLLFDAFVPWGWARIAGVALVVLVQAVVVVRNHRRGIRP